jgi:hypothetical protein
MRTLALGMANYLPDANPSQRTRFKSVPPPPRQGWPRTFNVLSLLCDRRLCRSNTKSYQSRPNVQTNLAAGCCNKPFWKLTLSWMA